MSRESSTYKDMNTEELTNLFKTIFFKRSDLIAAESKKENMNTEVSQEIDRLERELKKIRGILEKRRKSP